MPLHNSLWEIVEPYLVRAGLYTVPDPTYGRWNLPSHPAHLELLGDPAIRHRYRRVFLRPEHTFATSQELYDSTEIVDAEDVSLTSQELEAGVKKGGRWVFYIVFEMDEEPIAGWAEGGRGRGRDLMMVHGLSDYGLRYAPHISHFLKAGFRVIVPDLPSYGRSTGVNSYLPSLLLLPAALHAVLTDVVQVDLAKGVEQRKVFLSGAQVILSRNVCKPRALIHGRSMGGWTVLYYILKYPPTASTIEVAAEAAMPDVKPPRAGKGYLDRERPRQKEKARVQVAGAFVLCPMVEASKQSRPSTVVEYIGRMLKYFAGTLPIAAAVRGNVSDDPRVEEDFYADPLCYHGLLRVSTGLSLLEGMIELQKRAEEINIRAAFPNKAKGRGYPIRLVHGSTDRATSHLATLRLYDRLPNEDKEIQIYDGYEHVMMKVPSGETKQTTKNDKECFRISGVGSWLVAEGFAMV